jgi:hypothetical protein
LQQKNIDLLELARMVKDGSDVNEEDFVELMRGVLPLDSLKDITPDESEWLFMAATWLFDYTLLLWEFHQVELNKGTTHRGHPGIPGSSGPFIENILTRGNNSPDFSQLKNFGIERSLEP